jgi:hypothetical protein
MSTPASPRRAWLPLPILGLLSLACHAPQPEAELVTQPPSAAPDPRPGEVGAFSLALAVTPSDVRCARATLTTGAGDQLLRAFDTNPSGDSRFFFGGVPPGRIRVFVEAFNVACSGLTATTPATWVSEPTELDLLPGITPMVGLVLRRPASFAINGDFREANPGVSFNFATWKAPTAIIGASVESQFLGQLSNSTSAPFTPSFTFSGDGASFGVSNTCLAGETCCQTGRPIPAGGSCAMHLVFHPNRTGKTQAILDAGNNVFVPVSGSGAVRGNATLTPPNADLGAVAQFTPTIVSFTVSNGNTIPFPTTAFLTGASEFQINGGSCLGLTELDPGASCTVSVLHTPSTLGPRSAVLNVGAMSGGLQASLEATAVAAPFPVITPFTRDFGTVAVGQSADLTLTVLNPTTVSIALNHGFGGINATEFSRLNGVGGTCSTLLPAGASCIVFVRFSPTSPGSKTATFTMGADLTPATLTGVGASAGSVRFNADSFDFGSVTVGQSQTQTLTLSNTTPSPFTINASLTNTTDFSRTGGTCGGMLPAGGTCTFVMAFAPTAAGSRTAMLSAGAGSAPATLVGTGVAGGSVTISPAARNFGNVNLGQASDAIFTVANTTASTFALSIGLGMNTGGDFSVQPGGTCGSAVVSDFHCTIFVRFKPLSAGPKMVTLNAGTGVPPATLTGTGVDAPGPITKLVVNDHSMGLDPTDNSTQWVVQPDFHAGGDAFSDRTLVTIADIGNGSLKGKTWLRTAADSKLFGMNVMPRPALASFTVTGSFVYLLIDDRHNTGSRPLWLDGDYTDMGFNVMIDDHSGMNKPYSVWRRPVLSGSTVTLPSIGSNIAPCYIVVVE